MGCQCMCMCVCACACMRALNRVEIMKIEDTFKMTQDFFRSVSNFSIHIFDFSRNHPSLDGPS